MHYDCPKIVDLLVDYLEGELTEEEREELESHLELCPPCVRFVDTYRQTSEICREALRKSMPPELENKLLSFLRDRCKDCDE